MSNKDDLISVAQAASILRITPRQVHRRIRAGKIPAQKLPGKTGSYILIRGDVETLAA